MGKGKAMTAASDRRPLHDGKCNGSVFRFLLESIPQHKFFELRPAVVTPPMNANFRYLTRLSSQYPRSVSRAKTADRLTERQSLAATDSDTSRPFTTEKSERPCAGARGRAAGRRTSCRGRGGGVASSARQTRAQRIYDTQGHALSEDEPATQLEDEWGEG
eukprot:8454980-Pyramimonas_sp.AAC.1